MVNVLKFLKGLIVSLMQIVAFLILYVALNVGIMYAYSYFTRWTPVKPSSEIGHLCYVAVMDETRFIRYHDLASETLDSSEAASWKKDDNVFSLSTKNDTKTVFVDYGMGDYFAWFTYRIQNNKVLPVSCRVFGMGTAVIAFPISLGIILLFSIVRHVLRAKRRKS